MNKFESNEDFKAEIERCLKDKASSYMGDPFEDFLTCGGCLENTHRLEFITQEEPDDEYSGPCYTVLKLDGVLYKVCYTYTSHWGYNLDYFSFHETKPVEVTKIEYE